MPGAEGLSDMSNTPANAAGVAPGGPKQLRTGGQVARRTQRGREVSR